MNSWKTLSLASGVNELQDFLTPSATQETQREREREREGGDKEDQSDQADQSDSRAIIALDRAKR